MRPDTLLDKATAAQGLRNSIKGGSGVIKRLKFTAK
jgi:hypothetical protein